MSRHVKSKTTCKISFSRSGGGRFSNKIPMFQVMLELFLQDNAFTYKKLSRWHIIFYTHCSVVSFMLINDFIKFINHYKPFQESLIIKMQVKELTM